ncbi:hypothetical protein WICMUC_004738 [Wickerhamomyces mucosus]|uniref:Uncharacterized protein n=1 Tax=Wickerhamomyces mucosus TaxID=1378264 RepID=A0A9P8T9U8_9ASCO|nr:hypothetical protein WICMUC_004738 [Wickerhamomyces mucosus]
MFGRLVSVHSELVVTHVTDLALAGDAGLSDTAEMVELGCIVLGSLVADTVAGIVAGTVAGTVAGIVVYAVEGDIVSVLTLVGLKFVDLDLVELASVDLALSVLSSVDLTLVEQISVEDSFGSYDFVVGTVADSAAVAVALEGMGFDKHYLVEHVLFVSVGKVVGFGDL